VLIQGETGTPTKWASMTAEKGAILAAKWSLDREPF
jgi:hypothetical protein